jgi:zinc transport system substrate-binding protein
MKNAIMRFLVGLLVCASIPAMAAEKIPVSVSIAPQAFFVEKVGGERISVHVLLPPGRSPATYAPTPDHVSQLTRSRLLFRIGVPFETVLLPGIEQTVEDLEIVDTRRGITLRRFEGDDHAHGHVGHEEEGHHDGHEDSDGEDKHAFHADEGHDPHIWLDPLLVKKQAATMRDALTAIDPEGGPFYRENCREFEKELADLDARIREVLAPVKGASLLVFHPSFGYFAEAYGLRQVAVEKAGKSPRGKELSRLIKLARKENVRIVFVQPQFDQHAAEKIAGAINGAVVPLDPLARDYIANMEAMARIVAEALKQ